jgi:hypothetical protein
MNYDIDNIEKKITDFWTYVFKCILFFLNDNHKSLIVSIIHYSIFIIGFLYFFFVSNPGDIFRILFFFFVFFGALSYFIFNKCFFTSIELELSKNKNIIQSFMDKYFGEEIEGNTTSKFVLFIGSIIIGFNIINDYTKSSIII